jgi:predicted ABC-class ATPase
VQALARHPKACKVMLAHVKFSFEFLKYKITSHTFASLVSFQSIEMGADLLLVDEDTCATNFMIRDEKMMQLVKNDPITPFLHVVRSMFDDFGISTIMVLGGAGDYFDVADNVIMMDCYQCHDVTDKAKELVDSVAGSIVLKSPSHGVAFRKGEKRYPRASAFSSRGKAKVHSKNVITYGDTELDISGLEQVVTKSQTNAIVNALQNMPLFAAGGTMTLREALQSMDQKIDQDGLDVLCPNQFDGEMARPRILEIAGAANRLRRDNKVRQKR